ncbi:MAG TPA: c-type cytochrome [Bryobacteraceae bacterium]|nr:c-type cytochrome [Bryobacteraceae bacterium]
MRAGFLLGFLCIAGTLPAQHSFTPADVENGSRLYQGNCVNCHGPDGDFIPNVDFSHGKFIRAVSDDDIARVIINGVPGAGMPAHNFTGPQAELVVAYLRSLATSASHYSGGAGDKTRGKNIVEGKGQCLTCHRIGGNGSRIAPDLSDIGAYRRAGELERSLTDPDAEIAPTNRFFRVVLKNGTTFTGRLLNEDTFTMQFMNAKEQLVSLQKSDIRQSAFLTKSSMPSYKDRLSPQELADVVSYLVSLKGVDRP